MLEIFPVGRKVLCDLCGKDFTDSPEEGGLQFSSNAVCPHCAVSLEKDAEKYNETQFIRRRCPKGMTFADWVRDVLREGKPAAVEIWSPDPDPEEN